MTARAGQVCVGIVEGVVPPNVKGVSEAAARILRNCAVFVPSASVLEAVEALD